MVSFAFIVDDDGATAGFEALGAAATCADEDVDDAGFEVTAAAGMELDDEGVEEAEEAFDAAGGTTTVTALDDEDCAMLGKISDDPDKLDDADTAASDEFDGLVENPITQRTNQSPNTPDTTLFAPTGHFLYLHIKNRPTGAKNIRKKMIQPVFRYHFSGVNPGSGKPIALLLAVYEFSPPELPEPTDALCRDVVFRL